MYNKIDINAEHNELILKNSHGDHTIVPANKRDWVKRKLSEGCHDCIDSLVETLPVASQYAQDGSVYPPDKKVQVYNGDVKYNVKSLAPRVGSRRNEDGTESTHLMTYSSGDNKYYAYPTLFQNDKQEWQQLDDKDDWAAFKEAKRRKEVFEFDDEKSASDFAKGSWKNNYKEYDINSPEYRDLYSSGKLTSYDKNSDTYTATPLKEVTITAEAPQWLKYKREYEETNPKSNHVNQYLTPLAKSLGNTETNYPKRLDDEYEQKSLDYVSEQLVKNKPQGKLSRVEWLNSLSDKEEELIKRNPKYQSSLWTDTKRGLTSLVEQNPLQTFQNILTSSDYSNREKREMLKDYIDHPIMSKLGDAAKILNPLTVPSKMIQSAYKDDYSFTDALKGKKNNAGIVEDIITDPLNFVGVGLAGKLSKADKVIDATKVGSKVLNKTDDVVKNLPKLEQIPLDFRIEDFLKNISSTERKNMEIVKKGNTYFRELDNPESLKRLKEFGDEYNIDLLDAYKKAEERWDYGKNIGGHSKFKVKKTEEDWYGLSTTKWDYEDELRLFDLKQKFGEDSKEVSNFYKNISQEKSINYISDVVPLEKYEKTIWHELSHDINKSIIDKSPKLQEDIKNIFIEKGTANLSKIKKSREYVANDYYTKKDEVLKDLDNPEKLQEIGENEFDYVTRPTETWAFLSTNLRQDLKNTGVIKNYNEILTSEKLEQAIKNGNTVFSRFEPYIKDKDAFIKLFNKMTLSIAPAALYLQSQNQNKSEQ
jgi:hypothetical protein